MKIKLNRIAFAAIAIILFQSSCKKGLGDKVDPEPPKTTITTARVLYRIDHDDVNSNTLNELWSVKGDGTDKRKISIILPSGWQLDNEDMAEVSSDGQVIIFLARNDTTHEYSIYKCNIDGTNVVKITNATTKSLGIQALINKTSVLYWKDPENVTYSLELWIVNTDGTNDHKINIILPAGLVLGEEELAKVNTNGQTIVFLTTNTASGQKAIYKSNIDGSNVSLITTELPEYDLAIQTLSNDNTVLYRKTSDTSLNELWSAGMDGSNKHKINMPLLSDIQLQNEEMAKVTKDGIFYFSTSNVITHKESIYKWKDDGSDIVLVTEEQLNYGIAIQSLY